jgi:hypothetical protein
MTNVFLGNGTITPSGEDRWQVGNGTIKFSVVIQDWPFCQGDSGNPCQGDTGEFLELTIEMKPNHGDAKALGDHHREFRMGENVTLTLSNQVKIDGRWMSMPRGFPKLVTQGSKQVCITPHGLPLRLARRPACIAWWPQVRLRRGVRLTHACRSWRPALALAQKFVFRFPKFSSSVYYDPLIGGLTASTQAGPQAGPSGLTPVQLGLVITGSVLAVLTGVLVYMGCRQSKPNQLIQPPEVP